MKLVRFVVALVVVALVAGCGTMSQSGHFDDLAEQEPVMANYNPAGATLENRRESEGDGTINLSTQRSPRLSQTFLFDEIAYAPEEGELAEFAAVESAYADAEAAGWEWREVNETGPMKLTFDGTSSVDGYWTLSATSGVHNDGLRLRVSIHFFPASTDS